LMDNPDARTIAPLVSVAGPCSSVTPRG